MDDNFDRSHPLYRSISRLGELTREHRALRDGAQQHRYSSDGPGIYAFSRMDYRDQREYVVALNNSEQEQTASIPNWMPWAGSRSSTGPARGTSRATRASACR